LPIGAEPWVQFLGEPALPFDSTCHGTGGSPALTWDSGALPPEATHLAWVIRSPNGVSWVAWDAPVALGGLPAGFPAAHAPPLQGPNFRDRVGWAPPCPPASAAPVAAEALELSSYVLATPLAAPPTLAAAEVEARLNTHAVAHHVQRLDIALVP